MTLQQLRYAVVTAEKKTISEAAASLYLAQPSLTKALKELEKEMGITIFTRTNRGVAVSKEGEVFLGYARQVLEQAALSRKSIWRTRGRSRSSAFPPSTIPLPSMPLCR